MTTADKARALADEYERRAKSASTRRKIALAALAKQARTRSLKAEMRRRK